MINIVIPMAGGGTKFAEKGYTFPKPLVEIQGKPMIEWVVKSLRPNQPHRFIFICKREHYEKYKLGAMLNLIAPESKIVILGAPTAGAAASVLLGKEYIDNQDPLIIAGSDQYITAKVDDFIGTAQKENLDGLIMTFNATHPKWSFAKVGQDGLVMETAEKNPISTHASVGIYYFKTGADFIAAAEEMIKKDIRTNGEFYLCPTYNEMILKDKKIKVYEVPNEQVNTWATPEDLESFLNDPAKAGILKL